MEPTQLNDIFNRLRRQDRHQSQLLLTVLETYNISLPAFKAAPWLLGAFDPQARDRAEKQSEAQLSEGGTSWEERCRPRAASLHACINGRPLRA